MFEPINFCDGVYWSPEGVKRKADGLAVRMTGFCDNSCDFCIASEDMLNKRPMHVEKMIEGVKESGATSLQVLGGEPLLFLDNCIQFVEGVREQINFMFFTTSIPYTLVTHWEKFEKLMEINDALSVSIQSTDWKVNNVLLNAKKDFDRISVLKKIVAQYGDRVTVVLNLVKGGVDSTEKFYDAMDDLYSFGVKRVRVNELQHAPDQYVNFEEISGFDLGSPYAHGCKTVVKIYDDMHVLVKRSCFLVENSLMATEEDVLKLQEKIDEPERFEWQENNVIYEDGSLSDYWNEFRDDKPKSNTVNLGIPTIRRDN